ncbi:hypothetical protein TRFO_35829 [Tritrichomonas foetus]|uniref:Uncharacterized protein n=1 Tax=Tritrichomonas foetus TaxID=1144522 RepID=A0A1J4JKU8_9EUKA|nr:hypothetical protein TRFO_35829 [Tritrichomonas foetus]|eukprot:OHS97892.1 hypothetical protein TRFO_35829 [Tritrichomonas foetus]
MIQSFKTEIMKQSSNQSLEDSSTSPNEQTQDLHSPNTDYTSTNRHQVDPRIQRLANDLIHEKNVSEVDPDDYEKVSISLYIVRQKALNRFNNRAVRKIDRILKIMKLPIQKSRVYGNDADLFQTPRISQKDSEYLNMVADDIMGDLQIDTIDVAYIPKLRIILKQRLIYSIQRNDYEYAEKVRSIMDELRQLSRGVKYRVPHPKTSQSVLKHVYFEYGRHLKLMKRELEKYRVQLSEFNQDKKVSRQGSLIGTKSGSARVSQNNSSLNSNLSPSASLTSKNSNRSSLRLDSSLRNDDKSSLNRERAISQSKSYNSNGAVTPISQNRKRISYQSSFGSEMQQQQNCPSSKNYLNSPNTNRRKNRNDIEPKESEYGQSSSYLGKRVVHTDSVQKSPGKRIPSAFLRSSFKPSKKLSELRRKELFAANQGNTKEMISLKKQADELESIERTQFYQNNPNNSSSTSPNSLTKGQSPKSNTSNRHGNNSNQNDSNDLWNVREQEITEEHNRNVAMIAKKLKLMRKILLKNGIELPRLETEEDVDAFLGRYFNGSITERDISISDDFYENEDNSNNDYNESNSDYNSDSYESDHDDDDPHHIDIHDLPPMKIDENGNLIYNFYDTAVLHRKVENQNNNQQETDHDHDIEHDIEHDTEHDIEHDTEQKSPQNHGNKRENKTSPNVTNDIKNKSKIDKRYTDPEDETEVDEDDEKEFSDDYLLMFVSSDDAEYSNGGYDSVFDFHFYNIGK